MSLVMRKPAFCKCENKAADQLRGNHEADQRLCFRYTDISDYAARFVLDLVGNPEDRFSHNEAQILGVNCMNMIKMMAAGGTSFRPICRKMTAL